MSMGQRLAYSFGAFGNDAFYGLLSGYLIMFITSHLFNSGNQAVDNKMISLVTLIIMALRIVELFIDPFIGNAIDRTKTRWGHFRPWVVAGGTVSAVLLLCLFTSLGNLYQKNAMLYLVIFAVMYITMDIFYSFKDVGFWSMLPSLTTDSREREKRQLLRVSVQLSAAVSLACSSCRQSSIFQKRQLRPVMLTAGSCLLSSSARLHSFPPGWSAAAHVK